MAHRRALEAVAFSGEHQRKVVDSLVELLQRSHKDKVCLVEIRAPHKIMRVGFLEVLNHKATQVEQLKLHCLEV